MDRRTFIATAGATLASASLAGCMGQDSPGGDETTTTAQQGEDDINLDDAEGEITAAPNNLVVPTHRLVETENGAAVVGTVKNTGDQAFDVVEVEVTLNDGDTLIGEWVDTTEEEIEKLPGGKTWRFMATFDDENVNSATGYTISLDTDTV